MPPFRLSYNIAAEFAGANRQAVVDAQIALRSPYTLVLDDYKEGKWWFTKQIQARSPETDVIHRRFWAVDPNNPNSGGWDGSLHRAPGITADNILNTLEGEQKRGNVKVIEQLYCEPSVHINKDDPQGLELRRMLRLMVDCMKGASARGMRLAVDIGQPVTWSQAEIDAGFYDELIFTFAAHPEHLLSSHEYGLGDLWLNTSAISMAMLDDVPMSATYTDDFIHAPDQTLKEWYIVRPDQAHLGRIELFAQRCRKIGAPMPRVVYTEVGWDRTRIDQQNAVNGINKREAMGYPTLAHYWHVRYPQWTQAQTAFEQLKWLNRAMPDYIVGACVYGFDTSFENGLYHIEDKALQDLLTAYSAQLRATPPQTQPTPPVDVPTPIPPVTPPPVIVTSQVNLDFRPTIVGKKREIMNMAKDGYLEAGQELITDLVALADGYVAEIKRLLALLNK